MEDMFSAYGHDFFKGWEAHKENFITQARQYEIHKKENLFLEGEANSACYYLLSGMVRVFQTAACGKEFGLHIRFPGSFINLSDVLENLPCKNVSAQALTEARVCVMSNQQIKEFLHQEKELFERAATWDSRERRRLERRCRYLAFEKVQDRLRRLLRTLYLEALPDTAAASAGVPLSLPLSQTHIASMLNSTQATVSCLLRQLRTEGILDLGRERICIVNPEALLNSIPRV